MQLVYCATGQSLHTSQVNCVAAHENGYLGISGSADSSAKLINCSTGKVSLVILCDTFCLSEGLLHLRILVFEQGGTDILD